MKTMTQFSRLVARRWASIVFGAALALPAWTWSQVVEVHPQNPPEGIDAAAQATDETSPVWFVELSSLPAAEGTDATALRTEQGAFRTAAVQARIAFKERFAFSTLWNGLSIAASAQTAAALKSLPGVTAVYPVALVQRPEPGAGISPELSTAVAMTGADLAGSELGYTGAGVKVAVIDTGIDIDHPDLGGTGVNGLTPFPSARIVAGYDFVGDAYNADPDSPGYNPVPLPDSNPDDCGGHGTHVAGIIGANGVVTGVAPGVQFGAYRVFGCEGSTSADIILAAMEQALKDRMDVVNMSLGAAFQWPQYPTAQASDRLVNRGIVVVASAGNQGASGLYSAGAPGVGKKVISVASFDNTEVTLNVARVSPDDTPIGITPAAGAPLPPTSGTFPLARTGTQTTTDDACTELPEDSLAGKIALIRRGTCAFYTKALNAQNAGAIAVILYNNVPGRINPTVAGDPAITIPVVAISDAEGVMLDDRLAAGAVDITWTDELAKFPNPATGGLISSFSAYGLAPDLSLKPDIGAPGGFIFSTYPLEQGGYADLSGTSMAAPHVAGAVALLLEARPHTPAQAVRGILQNSADPQPWWGAPALGFLDNVHRQGAGMLDIDDAILATTRIEPAKLELGESQSGPDTRLLWVENRSRKRVTYTLSYENALSTGPGTYSPSFWLSDATVAFKSTTLTVKPGCLGWVVATITPPTGPDQGQYGGYIVLTPNDGGQVYRVPFAGFIGDYQSIPVLTPTPYEFPWLSLLYGGSFYYISGPDDWVYSMVGEDIPYFLIHLDHYARKLRLDLLDPVTGRLLGSASQDEYLPRNSSATGFFAFPWDGTLKVGRRTKAAPDGQYVMRLSVLKALGSEWNPADWETWTSPVIQIDRP